MQDFVDISKKGMKKKQRLEDEQHEIEIIKAVAQAWHGHCSNTRTTSEFDAYRLNFKSKPTRFKREEMRKTSASHHEHGSGSYSWDFAQSLWDSYEIVTLSKKLETGLVLDHTFSVPDEPSHVFKKHKESKNSLKNLFNMISSRRFCEDDIPLEEGKSFKL